MMYVFNASSDFWNIVSNNTVDDYMINCIAKDLAANYNYNNIKTFEEFDRQIEVNVEHLIQSEYIPYAGGNQGTGRALLQVIYAFKYYDWSDEGPFDSLVDVAESAVYRFFEYYQDPIKHKVCELLGVQE